MSKEDIMGVDNINTWAQNPDAFYMKVEHREGGDEIVLKSRTGLQAVATFFDCLIHKNDYRLQTIVQHLKDNNMQPTLSVATRHMLDRKIDKHNREIEKYPAILTFFKSPQIDSPFAASYGGFI